MFLRTPEDFLKDMVHSSHQDLKKIGKDAHLQTKLFVEPCCPPNDGQSRRERTSYIPRNKCFAPRIVEKQRKWKHIDTLQRWDPATAQLLFRIVMSVNQLIVYGAVSDWCEELAQQISAHSSSMTGKPLTKTNDGSESKVAHTVMSILTSSLLINVPVQGNLVRQYNERFENLPEDIRVRKASADPLFEQI